MDHPPSIQLYALVCQTVCQPDSDGYYRDCYSGFTAISGSAHKQDTSQSKPSPSVVLRSNAPEQKTTSTGVLEPKSIFCNKLRKKIKGKEQPLINCEFDSAEISVKDAARVLNDGPMLAKIGNIGFHFKEVKYHNDCKRNSLHKAKTVLLRSGSCDTKQLAEETVASLVLYIEGSKASRLQSCIVIQ